MADIRQFFRYVIPGLIFTLQIAIYLFISLSPSQLSQIMDKLSNVGPVLSIFLLSGGLGFLLSTIYHTLYWASRKLCTGMERLRVNHKPLIETAIQRGWLRVYDHNYSYVTKIENQKAAWRIATAFWYTHMGPSEESSDIIKGAYSRIATLGSTMHGIGTALVGTVLSFIAWWGIHYKICQTCPFTSCSGGIVAILLLVFLTVLFFNFIMIKRDYQSVYEMISNSQLKKSFSAGQIPTLYLDEDVNVVFFKYSKKGRKTNPRT